MYNKNIDGLQKVVTSTIYHEWIHLTKLVKEPMRYFGIPEGDPFTFTLMISCNTRELQITSNEQKETIIKISII